MSAKLLRQIVLYLVPMILSLSVHEFAHAWVARRLGDDTAESEERVTLSPLAHIDIWGTLVIPLMSIVLAGSAFIGWAKPVPINPARFRRGVNMRTGLALATAAGPLSNLFLAVVSVGISTVLARRGFGADPRQEAIMALLDAMFFVNVGLCVFNLLPIPPLDGSRLLPRSFDGIIEAIAPYSFMLIMLVMMVRPLRALLIDMPMALVTHGILTLFGHR